MPLSEQVNNLANRVGAEIKSLRSALGMGLSSVQLYEARVTTPNPHTGIPIRQTTPGAPRSVCSRISLPSSEVPNGSLVEVNSMLQVGHQYTPQVMIGGYLQAAPTGVAQPQLAANWLISNPHGTNFNLDMHHEILNCYGAFMVTAENRSNWFGTGDWCFIQQIGYAASSAAPATGWIMEVEGVQINVKVTRPS